MHSKYSIQWRKAESLRDKIWNKTRMPTLTTFIQHIIGSASHNSQTNKRNKMYTNWKRRGKLSLYAVDMILYIENPKDSTQKLLEWINEFNNVAGYKIDIPNLAAFRYTTSDELEKEYFKNNSF